MFIYAVIYPPEDGKFSGRFTFLGRCGTGREAGVGEVVQDEVWERV